MCLSPYVGVAGGVAATTVRERVHDSLFGSRFNNHAGQTSGLIGGVVGVQTFLCDNIFVAVQGNALYHAQGRHEHCVRDGITGFAFHTHLRNHFQWGIDARLGMSFCGATPYILGGFELAHWKFKFNNDNIVEFPFVTNFSRGKTLWVVRSVVA